MKKTKIFLSALIAVSLSIASCEKEDGAPTTDTNTVMASVAIDATTELDFETAVEATTDVSSAKSTSSTSTLANTCAVITNETPEEVLFPKTFTVDFGKGCTINQITRKGKLTITLSGPITQTGSTMTITRTDYSINGLKLEGIIEYKNATENAEIPQWKRTITAGKLTDLAGRVFTNSGTHTIQKSAGVATPYLFTDDVYTMTEGTHTVSSETGASLTLTVLEPLIKKVSCDYISKGKLQIEGGILKGTIDYGNDSCDNDYSYTHVNGAIFNLKM